MFSVCDIFLDRLCYRTLLAQTVYLYSMTYSPIAKETLNNLNGFSFMLNTKSNIAVVMSSGKVFYQGFYYHMKGFIKVI